MKLCILLIFCIVFHSNSQSLQGIYELNNLDSLLTNDVKSILDKNLASKKIVFLGEAEHHIGSDFLAKIQFVKYLVINHGFKDIAFEGDFFALYNDHESQNLFPIWSKSLQCQDLFDFLKKNNVTIWGFDNQFSSVYSFKNFCPMLFSFLNENKIPFVSLFKDQTERAVRSGPQINKEFKEKEIAQLIESIDVLLQNSEIQKNHFWVQALNSFKNNVRQNASNKKLGIEIRDKQMASNLNFLTSENTDKKFLVWAANAHISRLDLPFMNNKTMGFQYCQLNPEITYHIAFSSIRMPYRKEKFVLEQSNDPKNILSLLPSISKNYYIDSEKIKKNNISMRENEFDGMLVPSFKSTTYFKHFDALVFIANGEKSILVK